LKIEIRQLTQLLNSLTITSMDGLSKGNSYMQSKASFVNLAASHSKNLASWLGS